MKIAVTGITGYIGKRYAKGAIVRGHNVIALSRRCPEFVACDWIPYELSSNQQLALPIDTDTVLHLASSSSSNEPLVSEQEVMAAELLIKAALEVGAKFIFVSSQTARSDAPTAYGRIKWQIEQTVLSTGGWIVRPGQVYGGELCGLFGLLVKFVRGMPILPAFIPAPKVQPIHVDDLAEGLLRITERGDVPSGVYSLASSELVSFSAFLREIAQSRLRCWRGFIPVPVIVINALGLVLGESMRNRSGLARLRSLFDLPAMETGSDLKLLRLTLRPLRSGMHSSGDNRRRCLLQEGRALFTYILKQPPSSSVLRRYMQVIEQMRGGRALGLPKFFLRYPVFFSLFHESAWADERAAAEFSWRLDAVTILAEATPFGADRFLGSGRMQGMLSSLLSMTFAVVCEIFWRILRMIFFPLIRFTLSRVKCVV